MIADTSALFALFDGDDPAHAALVAAVDGLTEPLAVSPFVVAELDYLVMTRIGVEAELEVLAELARPTFDIVQLATPDLEAAARVIKRYHDQSIGLADAHQVVMAERLGTRDILTLDRRHFDVLRPLQGGRFRVTPS